MFLNKMTTKSTRRYLDNIQRFKEVNSYVLYDLSKKYTERWCA